MANNQQLNEYMEEYNLSIPVVAHLCRVSVSTVNMWLHPEASAEYQEMPDKSYILLAAKLARGWVVHEG